MTLNVQNIMNEIKADLKELPEPEIIDIRKQISKNKPGILRKIIHRIRGHL